MKYYCINIKENPQIHIFLNKIKEEFIPRIRKDILLVRLWRLNNIRRRTIK